MSMTLLFIILITSLTYASEPWDKTDKILMGNYLSLTVIDHFWTNKSMRTGDYNLNPAIECIYDNYGTSGMNVYRIIETGGIWYILDNLSGKNRKTALFFLNAMRIWVLGYNDRHASVGFRF